MKVYRVRDKTTGLFTLGMGLGRAGRWHKEGKVYKTVGTARGVVTGMLRGLELRMTTQRRTHLGLSWRDSLPPHEQEKLRLDIEAAKQELLDKVQIIEYTLEETAKKVVPHRREDG